jgi:hypothetical protein
MNKSSVRLRVEEMESRLVPSTAALPRPPLDLVAHAAAEIAAVLGGTVSGTYTSASGNPDLGTTYHLHGKGTLNLVGRVKLTATLQTPGNVVSGLAGGTVTLKFGQDKITLQLTGPELKGFARLPSHTTFTYTVTGASGQFASLKGAGGKADLTLGPPSSTSPGSFSLTIRPRFG